MLFWKNNRFQIQLPFWFANAVAYSLLSTLKLADSKTGKCLYSFLILWILYFCSHVRSRTFYVIFNSIFSIKLFWFSGHRNSNSTEFIHKQSNCLVRCCLVRWTIKVLLLRISMKLYYNTTWNLLQMQMI